MCNKSTRITVLGLLSQFNNGNLSTNIHFVESKLSEESEFLNYKENSAWEQRLSYVTLLHLQILLVCKEIKEKILFLRFEVQPYLKLQRFK